MKTLNHIPHEIRRLPQWVCYSSDKVPKNPFTGANAKTNDPNTWGTYEQALGACVIFGFEGVGFVFTKDDEYFGVDLDHILSNHDLVEEFVESLKTYAEISRSGDGIHCLCKGKLPEGSRRHGVIEMYSEGRYFICTGNIYNMKYSQIVDCTESIKPLYKKYFPPVRNDSQARSSSPIRTSDEKLIELALASKNGLKLSMLWQGNWDYKYTSPSEADLALCNMLAFWTGRNAEQMDRLFRKSGLMREKWDEKRGSLTYGEITIDRAIKGCNVIYEPNNMEGVYKWLHQFQINK